MMAPRIMGGRRSSGSAPWFASQRFLYHVKVKMEKSIPAVMMPSVTAAKGR